MAPVVVVENVSKRYYLGRPGERRLPYRTFRDELVWLTGWPLRWARGQSAQTEEFWALKDVNFEVQAGEVVGVIGRNGAGKSTLLKVLSRITRPTSGRVGSRGRVGSLLEIGTGFHPELTGRENIYLCGSVLGMTRTEIRQKFDEIVAFAEVEQFLDTPAKRYSSGMYMRLAFAVMAHLEPEVLLVDEVLAVGDGAFQKKCLGKMGDIAKGGRTILFVSHSMTAVTGMCTRGVWLEAGQVRMDGPVRSVVAGYLAAGGSEVRSRSWERTNAPAGNQVWLRAAAIGPSQTSDEDGLTVRTPIRLEFEFGTDTDYAELNFSIVLYELQRGCIFNTGSSAISCPKGGIRGSFVIPGDLLNNGFYSVQVLLVRDSSVALFDHSDILTFEIHDVERVGNWHGQWIGAVRPKFHWDVTVLAQGRDAIAPTPEQVGP